MNSEKKYQVLARKYRPQKFADVVGHEAVLQTLKNSIKRGTVAHGYLFSGSRGVGKTTLARLFAKTLNCAHPTEDLEPCNQCPSCLDIASAQSLDVLEIDGASNRGIDDIRQINETVGFAPSYGKYKIILIDEVHMLTKEAFNALLKTLEEPPERVKFFFATTEPHKVPPTILSRLQRFDLGRLLPSQIREKLEKISLDIGRPTSPEAIHLIAHAAEGSLRDAESLFDQILCYADGAVTEADVRNVLGLTPAELFFDLDKAFADSQISFAFELTGKLFQAGIELTSFLGGLIEHYRHLIVCKTLSPAHLELTKDLEERYAQSAQCYTPQQCLAALDLCLKTEVSFSKIITPRTAVELLLLQILRFKNRIPIEVLIRRLSDLEESLLTKMTTDHEKAPAAPEAAKPEMKVEAPPVKPVEIKAEQVTLSPPKVEASLATEERAKAAPIPPKIEMPSTVETQVKVAPIPPKVEVPLVTEERAKAAPTPPKVEVPPVKTKPIESSQSSKHPSHYETLVRFAAVELEGTVVKT